MHVKNPATSATHQLNCYITSLCVATFSFSPFNVTGKKFNWSWYGQALCDLFYLCGVRPKLVLTSKVLRFGSRNFQKSIPPKPSVPQRPENLLPRLVHIIWYWTDSQLQHERAPHLKNPCKIMPCIVSELNVCFHPQATGPQFLMCSHIFSHGD
jgi:hypothetical protein